MSNKKEEVVDKFLESHNMDYLFCILADKESERLSKLPESIKKEFDEKITTMALKHIAHNDVPDFIVDLDESEEQYRSYEEDDNEENEEEGYVNNNVSDSLERYTDDDDEDYDDDDDEGYDDKYDDDDAD